MKALISALLMAVAGTAHAAASDVTPVKPAAAAAKSPAAVAKQLGIPVANVSASPVPGLYEVKKDHVFGYISADGKYLIQGDMMNIVTGEQITEEHRRQDRLQALHRLGDANMITFSPAPPIKTRYTVTIFTDITCPFCRRMHAMMNQFNERGIAIRYAFFPRSGPNTTAFTAAESVWCSSDRPRALTKAFADAGDGKPLPQSNAGCTNPVMREYKLGRELGLRGTPMLILPNGDKVDGYMMPKDLLAELEKDSKGG